MTDREKPTENSDNDDDTMDLNLREMRFHVTGGRVGELAMALVPYIGWSMVFLAVAMAIKMIVGEVNDGNR